jgi:transposase
MIQITPQMRILVAVEPCDFRKGIDGLGGICRNYLEEDPLAGCVFVFRNRRATAIKILVYDGQGFWLCQKRLSKGRFRWWPDGKRTRELQARDLQVVLWNGDPSRAKMGPLWRALGHGGRVKKS